jgi:hypothetical protein
VLFDRSHNPSFVVQTLAPARIAPAAIYRAVILRADLEIKPPVNLARLGILKIFKQFQDLVL